MTDEWVQYRGNWVALQKRLINETLAHFDHDFGCVGWADMRLALIAMENSRGPSVYSVHPELEEYKTRVAKQDSFTLEEFRRALP